MYMVIQKYVHGYTEICTWLYRGYIQDIQRLSTKLLPKHVSRETNNSFLSNSVEQGVSLNDATSNYSEGP